MPAVNKKFSHHFLPLALITVLVLLSCESRERKSTRPVNQAPTSPLSAWADTPRQRIEGWVKQVTDSASSNFIPVADRIAVFDNDGTLWPEQPVPNQLVFALDYLHVLSPQHPEWQKDQTLKGLLNGDWEPMKKEGVKGILKVVNATHAGQTEDEFRAAVTNWIDSARDRKFHRPYNEVIYLPMLQLLNYLREHDFKTFIVSGGGADFMRPWTEEAYGIPPYQVIGSYNDGKYDVINGQPTVTKTSDAIYIDDKAGKPVAIHRFIGKVPVFCAGNSDGDQAMMQYTASSPYKSMCVLLHHTDSIREYQYDTKTLSGHLETALEEARERDWLIVDMKNDFKQIFEFESQQ